MSYIEKVAKEFKKMQNIEKIGSVVGEVVSGLPNLRIKIINTTIMLEPDQLYLNDFWFADSTREYNITDGHLAFSDNVSRTTTLNGEHPHTHNLEGISVDVQNMASDGVISFVDTLVPGDKVKLTPTWDEQTWFIDYKVRKVIE